MAAILRQAWERLVRSRTKVQNIIEEERQIRHRLQRLLQKINTLQTNMHQELELSVYHEEWLKLISQLDEIEASLNPLT